MKKLNIGIMFAGQGTQYKEMTNDLLSEVSQETVNEVLKMTGDFQKYKSILYKDLDDLMENNEFQQYLLLYEVIQYTQLVKQFSFMPVVISGHSFGQFASYVVSKSIKLSDMLNVLEKREKLVKKIKNYNMAVVLGVSKNELNQIINRMDFSSISIGIINSKYNLTISGLSCELQLLEKIVKKNYICKFIWLKGSTPYHSIKLKNINNILSKYIKKIQVNDPSISIISNVNGNILKDKQKIRKEILEQLITSVNWERVSKRVYNDRIDFIVTLGTGAGLRNMCLKSSIEAYCYNNKSDRKKLTNRIEDLLRVPCVTLSNYILYIFSSLSIQTNLKSLRTFISDLEVKNYNLLDCLERVNLILKDNNIPQDKIESINDQIKYLFS